MFGSKFKLLRIEQNISLKEAAKNTVSISTLSRWENGQTELKFDQIVELLNNIHVSPLELFYLSIFTPQTKLIDEIAQAQENGSSIELKRIAIRYLDIYKKTSNNDDLFDAAIACNYYFEFTGQNIFPKNYRDLLQDNLSNVLRWNHYYIYIFGNTMHLLESRKVFALSKLIFNALGNIKKSGYQYYLDAVLTLLNAYLFLIEKDVLHAKELSKFINLISLGPYSMFADIQRQFFNALLTYQLTGNEKKVLEIIYSLQLLNLTSLTDQFTKIFKEFKSLKNKSH